MPHIIIFDDEKNILDLFTQRFSDLEINLEVKGYDNLENLENDLHNIDIIKDTRAFIFDLAKDKEEERAHRFQIVNDINENYNNYRLPIFIHSTHLEFYNDFQSKGTVFKLLKSEKSVTEICTMIKTMNECGFLDLFCLNGLIENKIMTELHRAFTDQYVDDEIIEIIESIKSVSSVNITNRTTEVFERIAIRSVFQNVISARKKSDNKIEEVKINSVEHFYRRTKGFTFWTGDILKNTEKNTHIIILTPRCDLSHDNCEYILFCEIKPLEDKKIKDFAKDPDNLRDYIIDNAQKTGYKYRYLPNSPLFEGGKIDFTCLNVGTIERLSNEYTYIISLSDELTNDVVRKFTSYLMRSGISETEEFEASVYFKMLLKENEETKEDS